MSAVGEIANEIKLLPVLTVRPERVLTPVEEVSTQ
jgi:hypothetical protein